MQFKNKYLLLSTMVLLLCIFISVGEASANSEFTFSRTDSVGLSQPYIGYIGERLEVSATHKGFSADGGTEFSAAWFRDGMSEGNRATPSYKVTDNSGTGFRVSITPETPGNYYLKAYCYEGNRYDWYGPIKVTYKTNVTVTKVNTDNGVRFDNTSYYIKLKDKSGKISIYHTGNVTLNSDQEVIEAGIWHQAKGYVKWSIYIDDVKKAYKTVSLPYNGRYGAYTSGISLENANKSIKIVFECSDSGHSSETKEYYYPINKVSSSTQNIDLTSAGFDSNTLEVGKKVKATVYGNSSTSNTIKIRYVIKYTQNGSNSYTLDSDYVNHSGKGSFSHTIYADKMIPADAKQMGIVFYIGDANANLNDSTLEKCSAVGTVKEKIKPTVTISDIRFKEVSTGNIVRNLEAGKSYKVIADVQNSERIKENVECRVASTSSTYQEFQVIERDSIKLDGDRTDTLTTDTFKVGSNDYMIKVYWVPVSSSELTLSGQLSKEFYVSRSNNSSNNNNNGYDATAPIITISQNGGTIGVNEVIRVTARENESGLLKGVYFYRWDYGKAISVNGETTQIKPPSEGNHVLEVFAKNNSQVHTGWVPYYFNVAR